MNFTVASRLMADHQQPARFTRLHLFASLLFMVLVFLALVLIDARPSEAGVATATGERGGSAAVQQGKYPELQGEFFSDDANLVDVETRRQISREMRATLDDSKIHVVLAVINQMSDYPELDQDIEKFTEAVAEHWQLGEAKNKQGILVLFSIQDRKFFVAKTKEMSTRLTDEIKQGMMGLPVQALQRNNVPLAMKRAANVLVEMVPSYDSEKGARNLVENAGGAAAGGGKAKQPPTRVIRQERANNNPGLGAGIAALVCVGVAAVMIILAIVGVAMAASRGFGGGTPAGGGHGGGFGGYGGGYGPGYHGGGGGFLSGMLTGGLLGTMFGGSNHGWGSGYRHEEHHHHYDHGAGSGGGFDGGGFDGGGFDYIADTFGGGDFDGGSMGEW